MPGAFTLHESSPQPPKHSPFPGCDDPIRPALCRTRCASAAANDLEAHHARPGLTTVPNGRSDSPAARRRHAREPSPVAGRVFVVVRSGIQTSCSRSTPNPCCAARRRDGAVTDIESRLLGIQLHTDVQDAPTIRSCQKHPDQQELPVLRPRLRSVPWPVRPAMQS